MRRTCTLSYGRAEGHGPFSRSPTTLEILGWPEHRDALDSFAVEMRDARNALRRRSGVLRLGVNRV